MHIDRYMLASGEYKRPEDSYAYEDAVSFIASGMLGFCGCGKPEEALTFMRDVMRHIHCLQSDDFLSAEEAFEDWVKEGQKIGSEGALYFAYYVLDDKQLTEHGGSVPGWLTPAGMELLQDLEELLVDTPPVGV